MHSTASLFWAIFLKISLVSANTYTVRIGADRHVNLIDRRFLSFTIDPKYLFSTSGKYNSKELICMASSLTPAYIRIAGPSTALMSYHNSSITINEDTEPVEPRRNRFQSFFSDNLARIDEVLHNRPEEKRIRRQKTDVREEGRFKRNHGKLEVSHHEWRRFIQWAKSTGFDLVFAVNNEEKMRSGMWDPNMALNILTVAEKANVGEIFWQLGYECTNQSIEEYLNDLETLRVITETFPAGRGGRWKVVGGDVTGCLHADSKSDFKDYVTLSSDMMDAVLLNGNSSTAELERMSERDRLKLLKLLSHSTTPLWLTEPWPGSPLTEVSRAADWLTSLGHAARNGFSVHYRELNEEEMYQPTLSFYMALLFKNLVGERVLSVDMQPDQAIMFAHCTSLRHKDVPGAVTLYGVNMDDEPARFSVKLAEREEGGDIMQFVLGHDKNGNIVVNGRTMYHEGDLKPVVKRVRPYKTLLINLPAKSFGFWVLANTKIKACFTDDKKNETENTDDAVSISAEPEVEDMKSKRSINVQDFEEYTNSADISVDFCDQNDVEELRNEDFRSCADSINKDLSAVQDIFRKHETRTKRQVVDEKSNNKIRKLIIRHGLKNRNIKSEPESKPRGLLGNLIHKTKHNITQLLKGSKLYNVRKLPIFNKNKLSKRQSDSKNRKTLNGIKENNFVSKENTKNTKSIRRKEKVQHNKKTSEEIYKFSKRVEEYSKNPTNQRLIIAKPNKNTDKLLTLETKENIEEKTRTRRNIKDQVELSAENDIDIAGEDNAKLWKLLRKIHKQFKDISEENDEYFDEIDTVVDDSKATHAKRVNQENSVDLEEDDTTFIKSTVYSLLRVISDLNKNLNKFWNGIRLLD